jgi:hypothetical protein
MVDAITPISASSATSATKVDDSLSITAEPDNKWVAERQSRIDADQVELKNAAKDRNGEPSALGVELDEDVITLLEGHSRKRKVKTAVQSDSPDAAVEHLLLSGESELIGTTNFDDETPFGERVAIV